MAISDGSDLIWVCTVWRSITVQISRVNAIYSLHSCLQLGQLTYAQGRIDEALGFFLQELKLTRSEVGVHHPRTATVLNEIALVYDDKNDVIAGKLYETALSIIMDTYGNNYIGTGVIR